MMTARHVRDRIVHTLREAGFTDVLSIDTADDDRLQIFVRMSETDEVEVWEVRVRRLEER